jgi:hypothetical protein
MWPRVSEFFLGAWLMLSPMIFAGTRAVDSFALRDLSAGALIAVLALLSFWTRTARAHLVTAGVALGLFGAAYFGWPRPGPPAAQNDIITALLLLMLAIVPNNANDPPPAWSAGRR